MTARLMFAALLIVLGLLQYRVWVSSDGLREVWRLEQAVTDQRLSNAEHARRNARLEAEVSDLRDGLASVEERARSELGMIRGSESFFQVIDGVRRSAAVPAE